MPTFGYQEETTRYDKLEDYYSLLLFKAGSQEATRKLQNTKNDFISPGKMLKESGAQVVFFSVLPVGVLKTGQEE